jgi:predicted metalloprotease
VTTRTGPFYCPAGRTIFMPLLAIRALIFPTSTNYVPHAFAISYVAAHEWAHHVQSLLGLLQGRSSVSIELQADCFAGVWGFTAWARHLVNQADILHTMAVANSIGDPPGMPPTSHGTGQQRTRAFLAGFTSGDPSACLTQ